MLALPGCWCPQEAPSEGPRGLSYPLPAPTRCFKLACYAVAVSPPLALSHYQIKFAATSLYDSSVASLYVISTHCAPPSSKEAAPMSPTSFEFLVPEDSPITISPCVGAVLPGKVGELRAGLPQYLADHP